MQIVHHADHVLLFIAAYEHLADRIFVRASSVRAADLLIKTSICVLGVPSHVKSSPRTRIPMARKYPGVIT